MSMMLSAVMQYQYLKNGCERPAYAPDCGRRIQLYRPALLRR